MRIIKTFVMEFSKLMASFTWLRVVLMHLFLSVQHHLQKALMCESQGEAQELLKI